MIAVSRASDRAPAATHAAAAFPDADGVQQRGERAEPEGDVTRAERAPEHLRAELVR